MTFKELMNPLIKEINEINTFIKDQKLDNEINLNDILKKITQQEKEYHLIKFSISNSKNNLDNNINLLKQKCEMELKIYETLIDHKKKIDELKKKHNVELPTIDTFTKNLFNLQSDSENKQTKIINKSKTETKKFNPDLLQSQLSAAITARRPAMELDD